MIDRRHIGTVLPPFTVEVERGRLLTNWVPQEAIRRLDVRFVAPTQVGERITCTGRVTAKASGTVTLAVETANEQGTVKITGEAVVAHP